MSTLNFDRHGKQLHLLLADGTSVGSWDAANNVDSHSKGPWPDGSFTYSFYQPHPGDNATSAYGSNGIFIFTVPDREGMGVHSGRAGIPDGLGRSGVDHCTMGCVRTTDDATAQILRTHQIDPLTAITLG